VTVSPGEKGAKNRPFTERLAFAVAGLRVGWRLERSFRTQAGFAGLAFAVLLVLQPAPIWWAVVGAVSATVLLLELVNSALEALVDLLHPAHHPEVGAIKDMMAGAVLLASIGAAAVGAALVVDRLATVTGWAG